MATITATSTRITISGAYKDFTASTGNTSTVIQFASGDAPASGDAGRFLLWKNGSTTKDWEIRFIESATSTTVTVGDGGFSATPASGSVFAIGTNLEDIETAVPSACTVSGKSYSFNGRDWLVTNGGFLADVDISIDTENQSSAASWQASNGCAVQFGRLTGGEANNSTITRQGCYISLNNSKTSANSNVFSDAVLEVSDGPIFNFYGCYIKSYTSTAENWAFMRGTGPVRMIGSIWDGPIGGAFYNSASELVDTKFRGNTNLTTAWSIRATFVRPVSNVQFASGLAAFKTFENFVGVFRDTVFDIESLNIVLSLVQGQASGLTTLIDCTTFGDANITDSGSGTVLQGKSVNYTVADSSGTALSGVKVAIYDTDGTLQDSIKTSSNGSVDEIVTIFNRYVNSAPSLNKAPFDIRIRKYGYSYLGFQSTVSEPIKQQVRLADNTTLVSTEVQAAAITGISLNFATETVTITSDADTQKLYDYYQYQLAQTSQMQYGEDFVLTGTSFDLDDWDMVVDGCAYTGDVTTTGLITLTNGGVFNGTRTDTNGTIAPPKTASITGLVSGSRLRIYNNTKATEVYNAVVNDTSYTATYEEDGDYSEGDTVNIRVTYVNGASAKLGYTVNAVVGSSGWSALVEQQDDSVYNSFGVDGSTITQFSADYINDQVDVIVGSNFYLYNFYAWWVYNLTTEDGIRDFFGGIEANDQANFEIKTNTLSLYLDNSTSTNIRQLDNRRLFRSDDAYPVLDQTTGGGGIDVVWRNQIFIAETGVSGLTPSESALLNDISTLATSTQLTSTQSAIQSDIAALNDVSASDVWAAATRSLTDKAEFTLTADERSAIATAVEQSILDENDGQQILNAIVAAIGNTNVDEVALVAAIRADLERTAGKLDVIDTATAAMESKSQADTRQAALIQAHGTTQAAIENLNDLDANAIHSALDSYTNKGDWKADVSALATQLSIDNLNDLSASDIDARLASYDAPTLAEMTAAFTEIKGSTWSETDTLEAIKNAVNSGAITAADVWTYATREVTGGTIDTNNDMRGTDNAALETDLRVVNENVQKASLLIPATEDI